MPNGVLEVQCKEDDRVAFFVKELCYKVESGISFDYSANPAEPWDAYSGIRPRTDGIPFLPFSVGGFNFNEFDPTGKFLYTISKGNFITHTYANFAQVGFTSTAISFVGFPAASGMTAVGIAVHPTTGIIYVTYIDGGRRIWLATITSGGLLQLVGDTQFVSAVTVPTDNHDITFTGSGQLLMAHGSNLYLIDHTTGLINSGVPITLVGAANNVFSIRNISRYANGDLHLAGQDISLGPIVLIYDGENYTKIRHWASNNSSTPPDSTISTAYPITSEIKFNRLNVKNLETNQNTPYDTDLVTGLPITIPQNATIKDCTGTVSKITSWTDDICYVIDKNVTSQGIVEIAGGQIVSNAACTPVAGFVSPAAVTYTSMSHNLSGNFLYALNPAGAGTLDTYNWNTISAPGGLVSTALVGLTGTAKSLRTRWSDGSLWVMTEEAIGSNRNYRFYIVNTATGACTLQGTVTYPVATTSNGSFTWSVSDELYFSYFLNATTYRISKLSKVSYNIQAFVADVNYVVDNINTDLPNGRLLLSKSAVAGLDFMTYGGLIVGNCAGGIYADAMHAPLGTFAVGDTTQRVKKVFIKDLITGDVSSYYHDYITGEDIILPALARVVSCDNSIVAVAANIPRVQMVTGLATTWSKEISAPDAKSVTFIHLAGNTTVTDGLTGPWTVTTVLTLTWTADKLGGRLIFTNTNAAGSFLVTWV